MQTEEEIKRPEETPEQPDKKDESTASMLYEWADALVYALIAIVLLFTLVFRMTGVVGGSMQPTLYENDKLIISNILYEPKPGDIVVVTKRSFREEPIVKRVIAVAGQTVDLDKTTGAVYIDGVLLEEDYVSEKLTYELGDMQFPIYVEEGHIFVMGDNRNHSTDSRNTAVGLIDTRMVLGKVLFRIFPITSIGSVYE
jgi:signal peptidase I